MTGTGNNARSATRERVPWRSAGVGVTTFAGPATLGVWHPALSAGLYGLEAAVGLTILGTALFGSSTLSERAFRVMRWIRNLPEPSSPRRGQARNERLACRPEAESEPSAPALTDHSHGELHSEREVDGRLAPDQPVAVGGRARRGHAQPTGARPGAQGGGHGRRG
jgi:hypothetical protein